MWSCGVFACVHRWSWQHVHMWSQNLTLGVLCPSHLTVLKRGPSLESGNASLARLASNPQALSVSTVSELAVGWQIYAAMPNLYVDARDLNSGLHPYRAITQILSSFPGLFFYKKKKKKKKWFNFAAKYIHFRNLSAQVKTCPVDYIKHAHLDYMSPNIQFCLRGSRCQVFFLILLGMLSDFKVAVEVFDSFELNFMQGER